MVRKITPRLDKLIARVRRGTSARGAKSQLAKILGVSAQHLNSWLSGVSEPGGEVTLHLLELWPRPERAKPKKDAGRGATRPAKAQVSNPKSDEKTNSDRRKN